MEAYNLLFIRMDILSKVDLENFGKMMILDLTSAGIGKYKEAFA